jgi:hypothetical protein
VSTGCVVHMDVSGNDEHKYYNQAHDVNAMTFLISSFAGVDGVRVDAVWSE